MNGVVTESWFDNVIMSLIHKSWTSFYLDAVTAGSEGSAGGAATVIVVVVVAVAIAAGGVGYYFYTQKQKLASDIEMSQAWANPFFFSIFFPA